MKAYSAFHFIIIITMFTNSCYYEKRRANVSSMEREFVEISINNDYFSETFILKLGSSTHGKYSSNNFTHNVSFIYVDSADDKWIYKYISGRDKYNSHVMIFEEDAGEFFFEGDEISFRIIEDVADKVSEVPGD